MRNQTIYYAHSKLTYGSARELAELKWLESRYNVLNPNTFIGERGAMAPYLAAVAMCELLAVSPFDGYYVGKGCFHEVCAALSLEIPVHMLELDTTGKFFTSRVTGIRIYDPNDWKRNYAILQV